MRSRTFSSSTLSATRSSPLTNNTRRVDELNGIVRLSEQFQKAEAANRILKIPTGDGMALVFYNSPEEPAQCAFEISRALKDNPAPASPDGHSQRAGQWCGGCERTDELAGAGINMAQRVMDCGDAGHILLSNHVAEDLEEYERLATAPARHRHLRSETRMRVGERDQPLLR